MLIHEFEKVEGGFFSSSYIMFSIKLIAKDISVKRRAADFVWLRDSLIKEFPLSYIPPLSMTDSKPTDLEYIHEQKSIFQDFLQEVLVNDELKASELLEPFLLLTEYQQFVDSKKQIDAAFSDRGEFKASISRRTVEYSPNCALQLERLKTKQGHVGMNLLARSTLKFLHR